MASITSTARRCASMPTLLLRCLWALRDQLQLVGTRYGCGAALCGALTALLDGKPVRSCSLPMSAVGVRRITTIEALGLSFTLLVRTVMRLTRLLSVVAVACLATLMPHAMAADLRAAMEADNARWLAAFNTPNPAALSAMYTKDALLLPPGVQPVTGGPQAIKQFWESRIKAGARDHTFEIVSVHEDGRYAFQVAKFAIVLVEDTGEKTPLSGNTVRIFERQADGTWLTKVHMFNRHQ